MIAHDYGTVLTVSSRSGDSNCDSRSSELLEANIIRRAQQGDRAAFESIYRLHCRRIYAVCFRMVRDPTEAEDLTHEAFLLVFRKIQTFRSESAFSTWLHRLVVNVVLMHWRKKRLCGTPVENKRKVGPEDSREEREVGRPDLSVTGLVDRLSLERAVHQLSPACKLVFVLHDIQGYKHNEIAGMMDSSVGTSKGRLHRARSRLRQLLLGSRNYLPINHEATG
jgi:RNA polymerase sigma-70 factor (ECF subfamily)